MWYHLVPCVGPPPRIKISAPKTVTFFPMLPSSNENSERESNPML